LARGELSGDGKIKSRSLVRGPLFNVEQLEMNSGANGLLASMKLQIVAVTGGRVEIQGGSEAVILSTGQFCLIPAGLERTEITVKSDATLLRVEAN
jgi:mannose-6-phosphate isomerase class I